MCRVSVVGLPRELRCRTPTGKSFTFSPTQDGICFHINVCSLITECGHPCAVHKQPKPDHDQRILWQTSWSERQSSAQQPLAYYLDLICSCSRSGIRGVLYTCSPAWCIGAALSFCREQVGLQCSAQNQGELGRSQGQGLRSMRWRPGSRQRSSIAGLANCARRASARRQGGAISARRQFLTAAASF